MAHALPPFTTWKTACKTRPNEALACTRCFLYSRPSLLSYASRYSTHSGTHREAQQSHDSSEIQTARVPRSAQCVCLLQGFGRGGYSCYALVTACHVILTTVNIAERRNNQGFPTSTRSLSKSEGPKENRNETKRIARMRCPFASPTFLKISPAGGSMTHVRTRRVHPGDDALTPSFLSSKRAQASDSIPAFDGE